MTVEDLLRKIEDELMNDPQIQSAVQELEGIILAHYPDARFQVGVADDPIGIHITATVDVEDTEDVTNLYLHRLMEMQVEERLPVYVLTVPPMPGKRQGATEEKYRTSAAGC